MNPPTAWLFPGQGVDLLPVAGFVAESAAVRARLDAAAALVGEDLGSLVKSGAPKLFESRCLQPALTALALGIVDEMLAAGARPQACAGHSLGELAALSASGAMSATDALRLAAARGEAMGRAAREHAGGMFALTDCDRATLDQALALGTRAGALAIATRNAPNEWVLSGSAGAIALVSARFRGVRLRVEGAWHSPAMDSARNAYRSALSTAEIRPPLAIFISGERGELCETAARIREDLEAQLTRPLDWTRVLARLRSAGVERFVSIGPGKALRSFVQRCLGSGFRVLASDSPRDLEISLKELSR